MSVGRSTSRIGPFPFFDCLSPGEASAAAVAAAHASTLLKVWRWPVDALTGVLSRRMPIQTSQNRAAASGPGAGAEGRSTRPGSSRGQQTPVRPLTALRRRPVLGLLVLLFAAVLAYAAHVTVGLGGRHHEHVWNHWVYDSTTGASALLCFGRSRIGTDRRAWAAIGLALAFSWLGDIYWNNFLADLASPPYPSWADLGYLAYYPPLYYGLMLLIRARTPRLLAATWLEGVVGALALATVAATVVFDPAVASTHGNVAEVLTNLAYPTFDVLLLAIVAAGFVLQGSRAGRPWLLLGLGLLLSGAAIRSIWSRWPTAPTTRAARSTRAGRSPPASSRSPPGRGARVSLLRRKAAPAGPRIC